MTSRMPPGCEPVGLLGKEDENVDAKQRALAGALSGLGGTFVLVGLRKGLARLGAVSWRLGE